MDAGKNVLWVLGRHSEDSNLLDVGENFSADIETAEVFNLCAHSAGLVFIVGRQGKCRYSNGVGRNRRKRRLVYIGSPNQIVREAVMAVFEYDFEVPLKPSCSIELVMVM